MQALSGGIRGRSRIILRFPMAASLDQIVAATRRRVADAKRSADLRQLEQRAEPHAPRGFRRALATRSRTGPAVIAELKKASPSRGLIRANFDPESLAGELEAAGATALSVLTDEAFFQGSLHNLERASASAKVPCLQKDFVVDEFQLLQARAYGADAILLIVAVLSQAELIALSQKGRALGLDVLCEAHNEEELRRAVDAGSDLIGVNNRDLRTFKVDVNTGLRLAELIPQNVISVAESGIDNGADIARLRAAGYQAFLIGESLMKAESPGEALQSLIAEAECEGLALNTRDQKLVL
jgi:indole-3-glycerol phosphate synthase